MIKLIELFAGIGTQYASFKEVYGDEVQCIGISEIDDKPLKGYKALHGEYVNYGDISKIESLPTADVWTYSFPCTDISIAGKKEGFVGKHSSLIYQVYRLLQTSNKPKVLIMENVANICGTQFLADFEAWIDMLSQLGYTSTWKKVKACNYGGGTIRERVFLISVLNASKPFIFPAEKATSLTLKDYLEEPDPKYYIDDSALIDTSANSYTKSIKLADYKNGGQGNRIYSINGQGVTLTASGGGKAGSSGGLYLRGNKIYKLSPFEMCRVMGWDKEESAILCDALTDRELGFCLGNAIDKIAFTKIVEAIKSQVEF